jgi:hypothetical protein
MSKKFSLFTGGGEHANIRIVDNEKNTLGFKI